MREEDAGLLGLRPIMRAACQGPLSTQFLINVPSDGVSTAQRPAQGMMGKIRLSPNYRMAEEVSQCQ